jgi:NADPH:quinone reductase-like Zn-dependent oxidoreductase
MSTTTRAVGILEPGGPEVLRVIERPVREPGAGEVRVRVRFAAVNPTDIGTRTRGTPDAQAPWTPGMDAAGTVEMVGAGVTELAVGQEVMAATSPRRADGGAQAELIVVPVGCVAPVPDGVSLQAAATLPMNGLSAILGLEMLGLGAGETLAVSGGAGLLASYVIPLAKDAGLTVIADARPDEAELVRSYGADVVVERSEDFSAAVRAVEPGGVAAVFDTALLNERALAAIRDGGGLAVVRGWDGPADRGITVHKVFVFSVLERGDWLLKLRSMVSEGRITLRPLDTFPPEQAAEAHARMDAGGLRGRVLIEF